MALPTEMEDVKMEINKHDSKPALTPPTSEGSDKKNDDESDSELSELEPEDSIEEPVPGPKIEEEDDAEIVPDHYYEGGSVPVFKPTMKQFRSFKEFIKKIDKYGMRSGIVKVIPPAEWRNALPALDEQVKTIKVKNPITQEFHGTQGTYTQANMEKQRSYNLPQWKALCEESSNQPPAKRGERRRNQEKPMRTSSTRIRNPPGAGAKRTGPGRPRVRPLSAANHKHEEDGEGETDENNGTETPLTPTSPPLKPTKLKNEFSDEENPPQKSKARSKPKPKGRQPKTDQRKSVSSRRQHNRRDQVDVIDEEAFKDFDYRVHDQEEWTTERVQELEKLYWKSLNFSNPMYGADMPGSLFDDGTKDWNVAKLENLLDVLGQNVPGVNTAYLYLGMWKASFAWHLEDVDLYSINYIHFGAPKQWYSISQADARKFEAAMRSVWPNDSKHCDQFLRHKTYLISPEKLQQQHRISVNRLVHNEGEFVITFPYGYHSGYNLGYNCAESVNFATDSWLDYGRIAKKCNCEADSVWVDVREIERKLRGEPTPEYYEETDDDEEEDEEEEPSTLPTPPGSVKGKPKRSHKKKVPNEKDVKPKAKKLRLKIKAPSYEPCLLCPNDNKWEKLLPTDNGKQAHRRCGLYTPETYIREDNGQEKVCDVTRIDKARLEMKCYFCRSKKGSIFQCSQKKCVKAYHATCAAQAGVLVDIGKIPVFDEDGTEYTDIGIDFRCKIHRGRRGKHTDGTVLEETPLIKKTALKLMVGDIAQFQFLQGDIFAGNVLENRKSEHTLLIEVLPSGDKFEVEYKWLLVFDTINSQLPCPSDGAMPLPLELARKSRTTAEDPAVNEGPKPKELFCDSSAYRWEEFETRKAFCNPAQVNIAIEKPKKLWFYLGKPSTEAKAHYTGDLAVDHNDPSANFLDSVRVAAVAAAAAAQPAPRKSLSASYPTAFANHNTATPARFNYQTQFANVQTHAQTNVSPPDERPYHGKYAITDPVHPDYRYKPRQNDWRTDSQSLENQTAFISTNVVDSRGMDVRSTAQNLSAYQASQTPMASVAPTAPMMSTHSRIPQAFQGTREYRPEHLNPSTIYPNSTHNFQRPAPTQPPHRPQQQPRPAPLQTSYIRPQAPVANMMGSAPRPSTLAEEPSRLPESPSSFPRSSMLSVPPTPVAQGAPKQELKGVSYLRVSETYAYLHEAEKLRPCVYQSPYAPDGGFTAAWSPMPAAVPKSRHRGTSISEDYLMKRSMSQQEEVSRKINDEKLKICELRMREAETMSRQVAQQQAQRRQSVNYHPSHNRTGSYHDPNFQQPQHVPMAAVHQPPSSYNTHSPHSYQNTFVTPNTYQAYGQYSPSHAPMPDTNYSAQPTPQYQQLQQYQQAQLSPFPQHSSPYQPSHPIYQSPQDFQSHIQRESQSSSGHGSLDNFYQGMQTAAGYQNGQGGGVGWNGYSGSGNGQGSPLKYEMAGGGGETLPMMRELSRY